MKALSLAIFFLALALELAVAAPSATAKNLKGTVMWKPQDSADFRPLHEGERISEGANIRTGKDSSVNFVLFPGMIIHLGDNTDFTFSEIKERSRDVAVDISVVTLHSGTMSSSIKQRLPQPAVLTIVTPQGELMANETFFGVSVQGTTAYLAVKEGLVALK